MKIVNSAKMKELAELVSGVCTGNPDLIITALNGIDEAVSGEITFITDTKKIDLLESSRASACIIPFDAPEISLPAIRVSRPDLASAVIHNHLLEQPFTARGIHPSAVVGTGCQLSETVSIAAHVCIGDRVRIGSRVTLHSGVVLGDEVEIGAGTTLFANAVVSDRCKIGQRVILHSGAVIGSDGFGYATDERGEHVKRPQVGVVHVEDDVEIGANSCVDRAAFGVTRVGRGSKIDNLVQVGHNVDVGEHCILVAQVGVAGSATLGRNVVLGAKSGIAGHIHLDSGVMVAAMAGVHNSQRQGAVVGGVPAIDIKKWGRATAAYNRLPEILKEVRRLRKEVDRLTTLLTGKKSKKKKEDRNE